MLKAFIISTITLLLLFIIGYFIILGIGKPIGTDLSIIGKGKPTLILAYENFSPTGGQALNRLRDIRSEFDSRLEFAVADLGTPQGNEFANQYQIVDGQAIFLDSEGQAIKIKSIPADKNLLRQNLESSLSSIDTP